MDPFKMHDFKRLAESTEHWRLSFYMPSSRGGAEHQKDRLR
jgi:hypothetical protein